MKNTFLNRSMETNGRRRALISGILLLLLPLSSVFGNNAEKLIKKIQKQYRDTKRIEIHFTETTKFSFTGTESNVSGTLQMDGKEKYRFDADDQVLVSNGKTLWRFNKVESQVLIDKVNTEETDDFFNSFLYHIDDHYFGEIFEEKKINNTKVYGIKLTPKPSQQSPFTSIKIWVQDKSWRIHRLVYTRYNGNSTEYTINKMIFNPNFPAELFSFTPPQGIQVIDLRL